jgi:hypothetical protein
MISGFARGKRPSEHGLRAHATCSQLQLPVAYRPARRRQPDCSLAAILPSRSTVRLVDLGFWMFTKSLSTCQMSPRQPCRRLSVLAYSTPKLRHYYRMVSMLTVILPCTGRSSSSWKLRRNPGWSQAEWLNMSFGNRYPPLLDVQVFIPLVCPYRLNLTIPGAGPTRVSGSGNEEPPIVAGRQKKRLIDFRISLISDSPAPMIPTLRAVSTSPRRTNKPATPPAVRRPPARRPADRNLFCLSKIP